MNESAVEKIVSQIEAHIALGDDEWRMDNSDFEALVASWRELGEALKEARGWIQDEVNADPRHRGVDVLARIDAALKAGGET